MIEITAEQAFSAYEAVRHRLPPARAPAGPPRRAETLAEIAEGFDVFLLDAFGVLNIGDTAIAGTADRIEALRAAGKRVLVVSNAASMPADALLAKYRRLGYRFSPADIVTSRATMAEALGARSTAPWGMMSDGSGIDDLGELQTLRLGKDPADFARANGFLLIGSAGWTPVHQALLVGALRDRPRPVLVANPDIVAPHETGFSAQPGLFAHQLADQTGIAPEFFGKPFANIFDLALARLGEVDRARVLMVGDSLHTDILGAQAAGLGSALVSGYGFFAGSDVVQAVEQAGIHPDFIIERP